MVIAQNQATNDTSCSVSHSPVAVPLGPVTASMMPEPKTQAVEQPAEAQDRISLDGQQDQQHCPGRRGQPLVALGSAGAPGRQGPLRRLLGGATRIQSRGSLRVASLDVRDSHPPPLHGKGQIKVQASRRPYGTNNSGPHPYFVDTASCRNG